MRPIVVLAALLILLLPVSSVETSRRSSTVSTSPAQLSTSIMPSWSGSGTTPSTGQNVILQSILGVAFYNSSGKITIQPATLFLNLTFKQTNSTGVIFTIDTARITIGPSPIITIPLLFTLTFPGSGQAFLSSSGRLTIQAQMIEIYPCQTMTPPCAIMIPNILYSLFLTGPARLASTNNTWSFFTCLFGFLTTSSISPAPSKIGLFFVVGIALGDLDEDGRVDILDVAIVALCFGADTAQISMTVSTGSTSGYSYCFSADLDGDGRVDIQDVATIAANFGKTY